MPHFMHARTHASLHATPGHQVELPLKHRELFAGGLRKRSGVLLYGPPGA